MCWAGDGDAAVADAPRASSEPLRIYGVTSDNKAFQASMFEVVVLQPGESFTLDVVFLPRHISTASGYLVFETSEGAIQVPVRAWRGLARGGAVSWRGWAWAVAFLSAYLPCSGVWIPLPWRCAQWATGGGPWMTKLFWVWAAKERWRVAAVACG